jgi:hypothetical protein
MVFTNSVCDTAPSPVAKVVTQRARPLAALGGDRLRLQRAVLAVIRHGPGAAAIAVDDGVVGLDRGEHRRRRGAAAIGVGRGRLEQA